MPLRSLALLFVIPYLLPARASPCTAEVSAPDVVAMCAESSLHTLASCHVWSYSRCEFKNEEVELAAACTAGLGVRSAPLYNMQYG